MYLHRLFGKEIDRRFCSSQRTQLPNLSDALHPLSRNVFDCSRSLYRLNKLDEAVIYIDAIRGRIGRPDTKATLAVRGQTFNQSDLREFLRHERRVELTYEIHVIMTYVAG